MRRILKASVEQTEKGCLLSICQFNILASNLASTKHFPYVRPDVLAWERRRHILLNEIKGLMGKACPDILCCQELANYWTFFKPELHKLGYDSVYLARPSLNHSEWSGEQKKDGCGIFYQTSRFELLNERSVHFHDIHDRVALILVLREKTIGRLIIVANTHLYWNALKIEDQLKELKEVEDGISEVINETSEEFKISSYLLPIFLCGDFNNGPNSDVYRYMQEKFLRKKCILMRSAYDTYTHVLQKNPRAPPTLRSLSLPPSSPTLNSIPSKTSPNNTYSSFFPNPPDISLSPKNTKRASNTSPPSSSSRTTTTTIHSTSTSSLETISEKTPKGSTHLQLASPTQRRLSIPDDRSIPPAFQPLPTHSSSSSSSISSTMPPFFRSVTAPPGQLLNPSIVVEEDRSPWISPQKPLQNEKSKALSDTYGSEYEPTHTTLNYKRAWTIDYIWHSNYVLRKGGNGRDDTLGRLHPQLVSLLEVPSEGDLRAEDGPEGWVEKEKKIGEPLLDPQKNNNGIPNSIFGSDHIPLLAIFYLPALSSPSSPSSPDASPIPGSEKEN